MPKRSDDEVARMRTTLFFLRSFSTPIDHNDKAFPIEFFSSLFCPAHQTIIMDEWKWDVFAKNEKQVLNMRKKNLYKNIHFRFLLLSESLIYSYLCY